MPIALNGNWVKGLACDYHTQSSTYLGVDETGRDRFDTVRTPMGELVFQLKYRQDRAALPGIIERLQSISGIEKFNAIVPVPPTRKDRRLQPVPAIAEALARQRGVPCVDDALVNDGDAELKGLTDPVERHERLRAALRLTRRDAVEGCRILLVDDLYRSGATLMAATEVLYTAGGAREVCVLAMTCTRSHR
jgi:competence protein ComFC